ncbi:hypothetical protein RKD46_003545 [Streptomyces pseudovenezuelae]
MTGTATAQDPKRFLGNSSRSFSTGLFQAICPLCPEPETAIGMTKHRPSVQAAA